MENLTDEQFKAVIVVMFFVMPMVISGIIYLISEKIEGIIKKHRKGEHNDE